MYLNQRNSLIKLINFIYEIDEEYEKNNDENGNRVMRRDFFKIEKHPKLEKPWASTKSKYVSAIDKLNETIEKLKIVDIM